jgi:FlaA1/EpsC-like NDP-sugar epimerase
LKLVFKNQVSIYSYKSQRSQIYRFSPAHSASDGLKSVKNFSFCVSFHLQNYLIETMQRARIALIGTGRMGDIRAKLMYSNPSVDFVSVVDMNEKKASALADKYSVSYKYVSIASI